MEGAVIQTLRYGVGAGFKKGFFAGPSRLSFKSKIFIFYFLFFIFFLEVGGGGGGGGPAPPPPPPPPPAPGPSPESAAAYEPVFRTLNCCELRGIQSAGGSKFRNILLNKNWAKNY